MGRRAIKRKIKRHRKESGKEKEVDKGETEESIKLMMRTRGKERGKGEYHETYCDDGSKAWGVMTTKFPSLHFIAVQKKAIKSI